MVIEYGYLTKSRIAQAVSRALIGNTMSDHFRLEVCFLPEGCSIDYCSALKPKPRHESGVYLRLCGPMLKVWNIDTRPNRYRDLSEQVWALAQQNAAKALAVKIGA